MRAGVAACIVVGLAAVTAEASVEEGLEALQRGDFAAAAETFRVEAEAGTAEAQFNLALLLSTGQGVERDPNAALEWLARAAEQDHVQSIVLYGRLHEIGLGVEQDIEIAQQQYVRAAELGSDVAEAFVEREACWAEPTATCLLAIAEDVLQTDGFTDPVPGWSALAVADGWLDAGDLDRAARLIGVVATAELLPDQATDVADLRRRLAGLLATDDRTGEAREIADLFNDGAPRARTLAAIAAAMAEVDEAAAPAVAGDATIAAEAIPDPVSRAYALAEMARRLAEAGLTEVAEGMADAGGALLPTPTPLTLPAINRVRAQLAAAYATLGNRDVAIGLASDSAGNEPTVWLNVARGLTAASAVGDADQLVAEIGDPAVAVETALHLAAAAEDGNALLSAAIIALAEIDTTPAGNALAVPVASALVQAGRVDEALDVVRTVRRPLGRLQGLERIVAARLADGDREGAEATATLLRRLVGDPSLDDDGDNAPPEGGDPESPSQVVIIEPASPTVPIITDPPLRSEALRLAAVAAASLGDTVAAEAIVDAIESPARRFYARLALARALHDAGADSASAIDTARQQVAPRDGPFDERGLVALTETLMAIDAVDDAVLAARRIDQPRYQVAAIVAIATGLVGDR